MVEARVETRTSKPQAKDSLDRKQRFPETADLQKLEQHFISRLLVELVPRQPIPMKSSTPFLPGVVACVVALGSCSAPSPTTKIPASATLAASPATARDATLSDRVHQEVNRYRLSKGARELPRHAGLDKLAQQHTEYLMRNRGKFSLHGKNVSHIGFEGRATFARQQYRMQSLGENVIAAGGNGQGTAPKLVELWAGSQSHDYTMRCDWTHTGVGVAVDKDGMVFSTQLFGSISNSQMSLTDRFR
jgi:uncharacterized protein YkwD